MGLRQKRPGGTGPGIEELLHTACGLLSRRGVCDLAVGIHDDRSFAECDRLALFSFDFLSGAAKSGVSSEKKEKKQKISYSLAFQ